MCRVKFFLTAYVLLTILCSVLDSTTGTLFQPVAELYAENYTSEDKFTTLTNGTYYYRVKTDNNSGSSDWKIGHAQKVGILPMPWIPLLLLEEERGREVSEAIVNADPQDALISRVEFVTDAFNKLEAMEFYGSKSDEDAVAESVLLYMEGEEKPALVQFNESGVLDQLIAPDGTALLIEYEGDTALVHVLGADGDFGSARVSLDPETRDDLAEIEALGVTGKTELTSTDSDGEGILSPIDSSDTPTMVSVSAPAKRVWSDGMARFADTKTVTVSRIIRATVRPIDEKGQSLGPSVRVKDVSCAPFECQLVKQQFGLEKTEDDWVLRIEMRLKGEVEVPLSALIQLVDVCEREGIKNAKRDTAISLGAKAAQFVVGCMLGAPLGAGAPIVGIFLAVLDPLTSFRSIFKDEQTCLEKVETLSGDFLFRDTPASLRITLKSKIVQIDNPTIQVQDFKPFSDYENPIESWEVKIVNLKGSRKNPVQLAQQEQCRKPDCQEPAQVQLSLGDLPSGGTGQELQQPQPFFVPPDYQSSCSRTECDFDDPLIYKGTGTMVDELTLSSDLGSSSKTCSDTPDYVFVLRSDGSVRVTITSHLFAGWDYADNAKGFEVDCVEYAQGWRVDTYKGTHQNGTFEIFLWDGTFSGTYAGDTLSGKLVIHKEGIVRGFTNRVEYVQDITHTFTLSKSCTI